MNNLEFNYSTCAKEPQRPPLASPFREEWFNADALINAYQTGKKHFTSEVLAMIKTHLFTTFEASKTLKTTNFEELSVRFLRSYVKIEGISTYQILTLVDKTSFISDDFRNVYLTAQNIENSVEEKEDILLTFSFAPFTDKLNEEMIKANGFFQIAA